MNIDNLDIKKSFCENLNGRQKRHFNIQIIKERAELTSTKTGLGVKVIINEKKYLTKRKVEPSFKEHIKDFVTFDDFLPQ